MKEAEDETEQERLDRFKAVAASSSVNTEKMVEMGSLLLSKCVYHYDKTTEMPGSLVPHETILSWPAPLLDKLAEVANKTTAVDTGKETVKK